MSAIGRSAQTGGRLTAFGMNHTAHTFGGDDEAISTLFI